MTETVDTHTALSIAEITLPEEVDALFSQLDPRAIEQFNKSHRLWTLQRRAETLNLQVSALQQAITENERHMQQTRPSAVALAALAQLQASGVEDIDLLDHMLERGDNWLDQTMQLLVQCERLGFIQNDYTRWCENALEGAYDWLISMNEADIVADGTPAPEASEPSDVAIENLLLQKLLSDEEEDTGKRPAIGRITRPLPTLEEEVALSSEVLPIPIPITAPPDEAPALSADNFFASLPVVPQPSTAPGSTAEAGPETAIDERPQLSSSPDVTAAFVADTAPQTNETLQELPLPSSTPDVEPTPSDEIREEPESPISASDTALTDVSNQQDTPEPSRELFIIAAAHAVPLPPPDVEAITTEATSPAGDEPIEPVEAREVEDTPIADESAVVSDAAAANGDAVVADLESTELTTVSNYGDEVTTVIPRAFFIRKYMSRTTGGEQVEVNEAEETESATSHQVVHDEHLAGDDSQAIRAEQHAVEDEQPVHDEHLAGDNEQITHNEQHAVEDEQEGPEDASNAQTIVDLPTIATADSAATWSTSSHESVAEDRERDSGSPWQWKELSQYENSVAEASVATGAHTALQPRKKIGWLRRFFNWLFRRKER